MSRLEKLNDGGEKRLSHAFTLTPAETQDIIDVCDAAGWRKSEFCRAVILDAIDAQVNKIGGIEKVEQLAKAARAKRTPAANADKKPHAK
jgi:hypothetical protein